MLGSKKTALCTHGPRSNRNIIIIIFSRGITAIARHAHANTSKATHAFGFCLTHSASANRGAENAARDTARARTCTSAWRRR